MKVISVKIRQFFEKEFREKAFRLYLRVFSYAELIFEYESEERRPSLYSTFFTQKVQFWVRKSASNWPLT